MKIEDFLEKFMIKSVIEDAQYLQDDVTSFKEALKLSFRNLTLEEIDDLFFEFSDLIEEIVEYKKFKQKRYFKR